MRLRSERLGNALFSVVWLGGLTLALRIGATAREVNPEHLIGLLLASYLGLWGLLFFRSRGSRAGDAARFAACTGSILAAVAVLELPALLGAVDYREVFSTPVPAWKRPGNRPDPELLYVRNGHQHRRSTFQGNELGRLRGAAAWKTYRCDLRYDRNGFRNPFELTAADVIVLGDSFVEGMHVADGELMTARLSERLGRTVANLGRTGDGPQQELGVLRRYGLALRPRTCIWAFYEGNDLGDALQYETSRSQVAIAARERGTRAAYGRSFTRNCLAFVIRTWLDPAPRRPAGHYTGQFVDRTGARIPMYFGSDLRQDPAAVCEVRPDAPGMKQVRDALERAHALCGALGIDLVVAFIPSKFRVYRDLCAFEPEALCPSWPLDDLPHALEETVHGISPKIGFLDLTSSLRAEASKGALLYLPDDTHWSAGGHVVAAAALASAFRLGVGSRQ